MNKVLAGLVIFLGAASGAWAASVTNAGSASIVLQVVEDGNRSEVAIDAGASETICPSGCFVTLPNGDRIGLEGGETIEIKDGSATVK